MASAAMVDSRTDRFDIVNDLAARNRRLWILCVLCLVVALAGVAVAFLSFARPLPVVYRSENPNEPVQLVAATSDSTPREVDAKRFFIATADRLHGWNSGDVEDQFKKAVRVMTTEWRHKFLAEVNEQISVPVEVDQSGKASRLASYIAARIRNDLVVDYDSLKCTKAESFWHCRAKAVMNIQPLLGPPVENAKLKKELSLKASFQVVPTTAMTLDGLLVSFWDAQERE